MTEEITDTQEGEEEPGVSQTPVDSQTQNGDTNSLAPLELIKAIEDNPEAKEALRKLFQSDKDKGVAKAIKLAEETQSQMQRVLEIAGVDPTIAKQAEDQFTYEQLLDDYRQGNLKPDSVPVSSGLTVVEAQELAGSMLKGVPNGVRGTVLAEIGKKAFQDANSVYQFTGTQIAALSSKPVATDATTVITAAGDAATDDENPIKNIEDSRELYTLAAKEIRNKANG